MKEITVEGYNVEIQRDAERGSFVVSVPELPGCVLQVDKEEEIRPRIRLAIGDYLRELASRRPVQKRPDRPDSDPGGDHTGRKKLPGIKR